MLLQQTLERGPGRGDAAAPQRIQRCAAFGERPMWREQQLQVRRGLPALDRCDWCDELIPLSRHRPDVAVQVAGIEVPAELAHQLLEGVVPNGRVLPPGADQDILRQHHVRAPHEQVQDLVLALRQPDGLTAAGERPAAGVEQVGSKGRAGRCQHAADPIGRPARPTFGGGRQCATTRQTYWRDPPDSLSGPGGPSAATGRPAAAPDGPTSATHGPTISTRWTYCSDVRTCK
jgi:hypothetical protein